MFLTQQVNLQHPVWVGPGPRGALALAQGLCKNSVLRGAGAAPGAGPVGMDRLVRWSMDFNIPWISI